MSGSKVDMKYQSYVFLGGAQGTFEARDGRRVPFFNMFVLSPASTYTSQDYRVKLFFDNKGRVQAAALDGDSAGGK